jgi:dihydrodipicolinate synthase/N-acetylneuraminate lyase
MGGRTQQPVLASGIYAALATPIRSGSCEPDTGAMLDYLDAVTAGGVNGLVLFGSTGEFIHFGIEERRRVAALALKRSRVPVLVNASHSTLAGAVLVAEGAVDAGAAGVLVSPPYFFKYSEDQIFEFYKQFLRQAEPGIPLYLYNLPTFLNPLPARLIVRLLETGGFSGIKDSSGDWNLYEQIAEQHRKSRFQLLVGNESIFTRCRAAGADGAISGVAAAVPELMKALDNAIVASDHARVEQLNNRLTEFVAQVNRFPSTIAIKQAASARGWPLNQTAVPFDPALASETADFQRWFRGWLADVLPECRRAR